VTPSSGAKKIIAKLAERHEDLYAYPITDKSVKHGRLSSYEDYRKHIHAFLNRYNLEMCPIHADVQLDTIKVKSA
jgi:hypothetical protein